MILNKNPALQDSAPQTCRFQATISSAFTCASLRSVLYHRKVHRTFLMIQKTPSADISCQQRALNTRYHLHLSLIGSFSSTLCPITGAGRDRLLCRLSRPSPETSSCIECFLSRHKQPEFRRPGSRATFGPAHPGFPFSLRGILSFGAEQSYSSPSLPFLFRLLFHYHK